MSSKDQNDPSAAESRSSSDADVRPADVKKARAALRKVETRLRFRQIDLDLLEEKIRAADVHLDRLKRMAGEYPSAVWENDRLNLDADRALRALMIFAESLQRFDSENVYPINWEMLDRIVVAAAALVELIRDFKANHRQAEKPLPADA